MDRLPLALGGAAAALLALWAVLVAALLAAAPDRATLRAALRLLPDTLRLVRRLAGDRALAPRLRLVLWLLLGWLAMPLDLVPDVVPVLGWADDVIVALLVLRWVARRAGPGALERNWPGSPDGLAALRRACGVGSA